MANTMCCYNIFDSPSGFPGQIVVRESCIIRGAVRRKRLLYQGYSLAEARAAIPPDCVRLERSPQDVASLIETWL